MIPVHTLSVLEASLELEELCDQKPPEDEPLALFHWKEAHQSRVDELEAWICMHQPKDQADPTPNPLPEPPMPPQNSPEERLDDLLSQLDKATSEATTALDQRAFKKALGRIYFYRSEVNRVVMKGGVEPPDLPIIPANPWRKPKRSSKATKKSRPQRSQPLAIEPAPRPEARESAPVAEHKAMAGTVAEIRRSIWLLMADVEKLSAAARASLSEELAMLAAAAQAAHDVVARKLVVA